LLEKEREEETHRAEILAAELEYNALMDSETLPPPPVSSAEILPPPPSQQQQQQIISPSPPPPPLPPPPLPVQLPPQEKRFVTPISQQKMEVEASPASLSNDFQEDGVYSRNDTLKDMEAKILQSIMTSVQEARKEEEMEDMHEKADDTFYSADSSDRELSDAMAALNECMSDVKSSTSNLLHAYQKTTNEPKRLSTVYQESKQKKMNLRQILMFETSKLVKGLQKSGDDQSAQLLLMNRMLQETNVQLLEEHEETKLLLEESLLPSTLKTSMDVQKIFSTTSDLTNALTKCQNMMMRCAMNISKTRKRDSNDVAGIKWSNVEENNDELKHLRAEVVRLRHAVKSGNTNNAHNIRRETADGQVIRDLKNEVATLRSELFKVNMHRSSSDRTSTSIDSTVYSDMQRQLTALRNKERLQVRYIYIL
jgi:ribosomal protein L29